MADEIVYEWTDDVAKCATLFLLLYLPDFPSEVQAMDSCSVA